MDSDDDGPPPQLVDARAGPQEWEDASVKVPLTIVTGMPWRAVFYNQRPTMMLTDGDTLFEFHRLPGSRQDDAAQLHPHSSAREEDCRHHERFVKSLAGLVLCYQPTSFTQLSPATVLRVLTPGARIWGL